MNDRNHKAKLAIYIDISREVFEHRTVCTTIKGRQSRYEVGGLFVLMECIDL